MTKPRAIAAVVRKVKLAELDEAESLRRLWIEVTGDPDQPIARVMFKRKLGEPAVSPG
jgi:hypothetical protein